MNFRLAVKAVIIREDKLLIIKRRANDVHKPGQWDIPGGRLEVGENPWEGITREVQEEIGIALQPLLPFDIHHFTRDDGQVITMLFFLCRSTEETITLSEEHTEYRWAALSDTTLPEWLQEVVATLEKFRLHQHAS